MLLPLQRLCEKYGIVPKGLIHIGAHLGKELTVYKAMGIKKIIFVEANPDVFKNLAERTKDAADVICVQCAISNHDGTTTLHVTTFDQSSSILRLKHHLDIYPSIREARQITVPCKRLDTLLQELGLSPAAYNLIVVDIQGAELLAFEGATETLKQIDAICTEVNFQELYEGCALIDQLDQFLGNHGFQRKKVTTPYHPSWGDAFYVKDR